MDDNNSGTVCLEEFKKGMHDFRIGLTPSDSERLFKIFDTQKNGNLSYDEFLYGIRGEMNDFRKNICAKAFKIMDNDGSGVINIEDVRHKYNAKMSEYAAQDAQRRGEDEAAAIQRKAASLKSSQRVSLASRGLDIGYGTAGDLQDQTDFFGQMDASTARYNAANQAWSARAQGTLAKAEVRAAAYQGALGAAGTLLSGAAQVASKWPKKE